MLKFALALSFVTLLGATSVCSAYVFDEKLSPDTVSSISVTISDSAIDGCWTNIGEAKLYAEDKLKLLGYNVIPKPMDYYLVIEVDADRADNGFCYGNVSTEIVTYGEIKGHRGESTLVTMGYTFINQSANIVVLDLINSFIKMLE